MSPGRWRDPRPRGRAARAGRPVVVLLSGGRDSRLPARRRGADRRARGGRRALHCDYGLRAGAGGRRGALRGAVRAARRRAATCTARAGPSGGEPAGVGARRPLRRGARGWPRAAATSPPATPRPTRSRPCSTGSPPRPGRRALLGMARARGRGSCARCSRVTREETAAYCARARARLARGRLERRRPRSPATGCAPSCCPALRALHPAAEANVLRTLALLRDEAAVLDARGGDARCDAAGDPPARGGARRAAAARSRGSRCSALADRAAGGPGPAIGHRTAEVLALPRGRRARRRRRAARRGPRRRAALRRQRRPGGAAPPPRGLVGCRARAARHRASARSSSRPTTSSIACASWARRSRRDYADRDLLLIGVLKGAVFFLADLMREIEVPCEVDFMAVASYGSATESSGVVRILKDLDTPIEGRDVLIVEDIVDSGLTLQYLLRTLEARGPGLAGGLRAADQARAAHGRPARRATSASRSRTSSRSATGSTTRSGSATCRTWPRYLSHRPRGQTARSRLRIRIRRRAAP